MAKCKECVYEPMCYKIEHFGRDLETDEACEHFRDTAKMVEMPVKAGDTIYEIHERKKGREWVKIISERYVECVEICANNFMIARCGTTISVFLSGIGETVFFSREEAEKALREYAANGH